jgi:hypothetical protein
MITKESKEWMSHLAIRLRMENGGQRAKTKMDAIEMSQCDSK